MTKRNGPSLSTGTLPSSFDLFTIGVLALQMLRLPGSFLSSLPVLLDFIARTNDMSNLLMILVIITCFKVVLHILYEKM